MRVYSHIAVPKSAGAKSDFGHFRSSEQHAGGSIWLAENSCSLAILGLGGTVDKLLAIKVRIPNNKKRKKITSLGIYRAALVARRG